MVAVAPVAACVSAPALSVSRSYHFPSRFLIQVLDFLSSKECNGKGGHEGLRLARHAAPEMRRTQMQVVRRPVCYRLH